LDLQEREREEEKGSEKMKENIIIALLFVGLPNLIFGGLKIAFPAHSGLIQGIWLVLDVVIIAIAFIYGRRQYNKEHQDK